MLFFPILRNGRDNRGLIQGLTLFELAFFSFLAADDLRYRLVRVRSTSTTDI